MKIAIIGAGGWGTALSILLAKNNHSVTLYEHFPEYAKVLNEKRENVKFLPGVKILDSIKISSDMSEVLNKAEVIFITVPSIFLRNILKKMKESTINFPIIVSCVKGIENNTLMRISEVIKSELGNVKIVVLSGPSHAEEVARSIPTAVVVAGKLKYTYFIQKVLSNTYFRVYPSEDVIGVELGGALKNVIAIAAGIADGMKVGDNAKAALMTRGLVEITRLGVKLGADAMTFSGLSGLGDLIVTCISKYSRNRAVGEKLAQGKKLKEILKGMVMVAEGITTAKSAYLLSRKYNVSMPITHEVYKILYFNKSPKKAMEDLLNRKFANYEFDFK
jgi:glycerol-3-phosphate dehydrogenase (NAD(P)+)